MRSTSILLLCIAGAVLLSSVLCSNANGPTDCCFKFYPKKIHIRYIKSYTMTDDRCARAGSIFVTQKSRSICVDPNMGWVQGIMKNLDERDF